MNQQSLKAYLDLIQALLSCPRGEEWILLRQNEKLVNPELVEVMEQVANHLAIEGDMRAAKYLHNWAGKLHHILTESVPTPKKDQDKTQAYVELIQALLNCPEGSEAEILAAHQELLADRRVLQGAMMMALADSPESLLVDMPRTAVSVEKPYRLSGESASAIIMAP